MQNIIAVAVVLVVLYLVFKLFKTILKWALFIGIILVAIAFFSNPGFEDHREKLTGMRKGLSREIKQKKIRFDDYKVFSLTKRKVNGKEKIVGIGVFGKVWYFDEKE